MKKRLICVLLVMGSLLVPQSALAWNYTGHEVVARIAWEKMEPQTRQRIMALMMQAPADADLASLLPADNRPLIFRQRDLFMLAATWADIVRSDEFPQRKEKYHHSIWHFTNFFWRQQNGMAVDAPELQPEKINIVERLGFLQASVVDKKRAAGMRGIDVAWILHLVGDIHQPLHTSARVTDTEPKGDQGGNLFLLSPKETPPREAKRLHGYWDDILNKSFPRNGGETDLAYANRLASVIMQRHPESKMNARLKQGEYAAWAQEGLASAKTSVYPSWLKRFQTPSEKYRKQAHTVAEPAIALAGYRLADMLDRLFSN
ncbi:MAG: S1/P1 nuclease [Pyrinomonadaceae bacterium]|nr:S1/P1 nuclease [Pyrinomonadaceae bacterium]